MFQKIRIAIAQAICPIRVVTITVATSIEAPTTIDIT